ncbi:tetratricopeptide repeat protein [Draconibacterium halophilum]|uniref:Tetratricopeptide repeat protein n=1 Tax=Draconibacterium halophilum TaxID=2706887 RepID=A0A6C0RHA8_9BACT|nr:tetratricopeptide repeat protein [Draconibacterium halophilum]QIA08471.1 tetratricopeptide repeat protein [Draconibacterium halophilum]
MEKAIEINNKGVQHFLNKEFDQAEEQYLQALKLDNKNATALNNLGLLHHQKKDYEQAERYFLNAININHKATYFLNLANAQVFLRKWEDAETNYQTALKLQPNNENVLASLARFYENSNKHQQANEVWLSLVQQSPRKEHSIDLAKNLMTLKRFEEALAVLSNHPWFNSSAAIQFYAGICEFNLKNYGLAELAFKNSLAIDPDNFKTRHYLAINFIAKGASVSALKELNFLMRLNPENEKVRLDAVSVLLSLKRWEEAQKLNNEVLTLNEGSAKALEYKKIIEQMKSK